MSQYHYTREAGADGTILTTPGPAQGVDLATLLDRQRPPLKVCLEIGSAVADILTIAEEDQAVHGDIKPGNVLIEPNGAINVAGWGVTRRTSRAPEGRPSGPRTDIFGLGVVMHSMMSDEPLGMLPEDPDAHDDAVVERVLDMDFSEARGKRWIEDVRRFLCTIMAYEQHERPEPLDAANVLAFVAERCNGQGVERWAQNVAAGPATGPEVLPAPTRQPLNESPSQRQAPSSRGETTSMWTRERLRALVDEEDEENDELDGPEPVPFQAQQVEPPAVGEGTWDNEPARPAPPTWEPPPSAWDAPEPPRRAAPEPLPPPQPAPAPIFDNPPPTAPPPPTPPASAPPPPPPPLSQPPTAPPPPAPAGPPPSAQPVAWTPQQQPPSPPPEKEESGGGALKILGCVALLALVGCLGIGGGGVLWFALVQDDGVDVEVEAHTVDERDALLEDNFAGLLDSDVEPEPEEAEPAPEPEPAPRPKKSTPTTTKKSTPTTTKTSTPTPKKSTPTASPKKTETTTTTTTPTTTATATTPPGGAYDTKITLVSDDKAELRCGDGQQVKFNNSTRLTFKGTVSCVVLADGARGVLTVTAGGAYTCTKSYSGSAITCTGP